MGLSSLRDSRHRNWQNQGEAERNTARGVLRKGCQDPNSLFLSEPFRR